MRYELSLSQNLFRRPLCKNSPIQQHIYIICLGGLLHIMRNNHNSHFLLFVELMDYPHYFFSASRIEHGRHFIKYYKTRLHRQHAGYGYSLLLTSGEHMRRAAFKFAHAYSFESLIHSLSYLPWRKPEILRAKSDVLFYYCSYELVIRVLKHHSGCFSDFQYKLFIAGIHTVYYNHAVRRLDYRIY